MKKLSTEQKAKRYDEALEKSKRLYEQGTITESLCYVFPELKESEDERIRKAIHIYLDWLDGRKDYAPKGEYSIKDMIAWLEKQGESYTKRDVDNAFVEGMAFAKNELEKQNKQKPQGKSVFEAAREEVMRFISLFEKQKSDDKVNNANKVELKDYYDIDPHFFKTDDKAKPFDKYEGLTDFERTLADICISWIGEEIGWKQYIKDNADILLKIAIEKFNSIQDASFEQPPANKVEP